MVEFRPFRGIHFNKNKVEDLSKAVCPPYDVISAEEQDFYYGLHPYNAIRLDLTKSLPEDIEGDNRYTRAAVLFDDWFSKGILVQEKEPSYYLLEECFEDVHGCSLTRYGLIGLARLEDNHSGASIRPHETTHAGPKQDRFELMKATEANFSPIFALYQDNSFIIKDIFNEGPEDGQYLEAVSQNNIRCRMFALKDPGKQERLEGFLKDKLLLIADGHHRYETSLKYREWKIAQGEKSPGPYDYTMMYVTNIESPGLCLYPTHRILKQHPSLEPERFYQSVQELFEVNEIGPLHDAGCRKLFLQELQSVDKGTVRIGCCFKEPDVCCLLSLKDIKKVASLFPPETPSLMRSLDVSILHEIIFNQCLGISKEVQNQGEILTYVKGEEATLNTLGRDSDFQAAFLLNSSSVQEIMQIALSGIRLPQKTTYFFPKLLTGLLFRKMEKGT